MSELKIQGEVSLSSENAETALDRVGEKAGRMATRMQTEADKAGKAVDGIGAGAGKSADQFTRAEGRISESIKRATTNLELLGKTASQKLEFKIAEKGLDASKFEPALASLRALEAQSVKSGAAANAALGTIGVSAAQTSAALRMVPAQMTDIVTSLQGGQAPMTVLLQQGGQLKDMFGGIGPAAKALGGYVMGLVNPLTLTAAAVGTLGFAYYQGAKEADAFAKSLVLSGNAAGTTIGQMQAISASVADTAKATKAAAAEAVTAFVSAGGVGAGQLERFSVVAIKMQKETGTAVSDTAKEFSKLAESPAEAVVKLNEKTNFLTVAIYNQIKALSDQGRATEAARIAQEAYADAMESRADKLKDRLGTLEKAWRGVVGAAKSAWDAMLDVGRESSPMEKINDLQDRIAKAQANLDASRSTSAKRSNQEIVDELRKEMNALVAKESALNNAATAEAKAAEQTKAHIGWVKEGEKYLSKQAQMEREITKARNEGIAAGASQIEIDRRIVAIKEKFAEKSKGVKAAYQDEIASILANVSAEKQYLAQLQERGSEADKLTQGDKLVLKLQEELRGSMKATERAQKEKALVAAQDLAVVQQLIVVQKEANAANEKFTGDVQKSTQSINERAIEQEKANKVFGLGKSAIAELTLAEMEHSLEMQKASGEYIPGYIDALESRIDAQKRLIAAMQEGEGLEFGKKAAEESAKAAKQAADDWKKAAEKINDSLTDALMRGFESGKSFAQNMKDTVVNMFKTMVLRPVVSAIVQPVSNAITSALGGSSGSTSYGLSGISNYADIAKTLYSAYTGGLSTTISSAIASAGSTFGSEALTSFAAGMKGATLAAGLEGPTTAGASGAMGAGASGAMGASAMNMYAWFLAALISSNALYGQGLSDDSLKNDYGVAGKVLGGSMIVTTEIMEKLGVSSRLANTISGAPLLAFPLAYISGEKRGGGKYGWGQTSVENKAANYGDAVTFAGGPSGGEIAGDSVRAAIAGTVAGIQAILSAVGSSSTLIGYQAGLETSGKGRGGVLSGGLLSNGASFGEAGTGSNYNGTMYETSSTTSPDAATAYANFLTDLKQSTLQAMKAAADIPKLFADQLAVDIEALTADETTTLLTSIVKQINDIKSFRQTLTALPFGNLSRVSFMAASNLISLAGSLDALSSSVDTYYQNYFSEAERAKSSLQQMKDVFAALGMSLPQTKAQFRALMEAQNLSTESGQAAYYALLSLSSAFSDLAATAEAARTAALASAQSTTDSAYSAIERAVQAQQDIASAAIDAATEQQSAMQSLFDVLKAGIADLYGSVDSSIPATQGRAFIGDSLANYRATGYLPDSDKLAEALAAVKLTMTSSNYGSAFDMQRDQFVLAAQLTELQTGASGQLTIAEQQLAAAEAQSAQLDGVLEAAQSQINALRGIDDSVLAVAAAVQALAAAMAAESLISNTPATISNIPAFASGGSFAGGLRLVGENGPELEVTGPSRIYSASDTASLLSNSGSSDSAALVAEIRSLREESRAQAGTISRLLNELNRVQSRWDRDGMPNARLEAVA